MAQTDGQTYIHTDKHGDSMTNLAQRGRVGAPINLPVNQNKDDDFYGIVTFLPKFSIMTS